MAMLLWIHASEDVVASTLGGCFWQVQANLYRVDKALRVEVGIMGYESFRYNVKTPYSVWLIRKLANLTPLLAWYDLELELSSDSTDIFAVR